ncbi:MAG: T9SS type A sorting domain-containing protein [Bacteroidales bacterium]|nr:T9SS type A sorting domain-containing protein [Bacteroidales bacterium]
MKKRFLPFSLLLVIMMLGQAVMADGGGRYVPRAKETTSVEAFMSSMRVNQHTGLIDPAWMIAASKQNVTNTRTDELPPLYWINMGPNNLGGRTTSVVYNNQNQNEIFIGSMGGGVYYTTQGVTWKQVGEDLMVSCMAQAADGTIYVGTGDGATAFTYNGLADLDYENSFIGSGIYTIKNLTMERMAGTAPSTQGQDAEWAFVNDIAVDGNTVIAATSDGLRYCTLGNSAWAYAKVEGIDLTGNAVKVKVTNDHVIVASVNGKLYVGSLDNMVCYSGESGEVTDDNGNITKIAPAAGDGFLDIAVAPSDAKVIYAATIDNKGNHVKIYRTGNLGETWMIALPTVTATYGHNVYGERGLFNHALVVDPANAYRLFVLGNDVWSLEGSEQQTGYYLAKQLSISYQVHGMNSLMFDPRNAKIGYAATDGGVYKFDASNSDYILFENCNRNYISTRCLNVAPSGDAKRILAGVLDHGPVVIEGLENTNTLGTAELLLPEYTSVNNALYDESYTSGSSAVSAIHPETYIITTLDGGLQRTNTAGVDYDATNFTANQSFTFTGYRMPIALYENFEDENSVASVWFKCTEDMVAGQTVQCFSNNAGYPFDYVLPIDMHYDTVNPDLSDSLLVPDPVTAKFFAPSASGNDHFIYMTFDALQFSKEAEWYQVATVPGYPTCFTVSADGDVLYVGTKEGTLVRISNLNEVVDGNTADITSEDYAAEVLSMSISDQCITSVSVFNEDNDKVVVTLGNYGNDSYILYSNNAMSAEPTFVSKQGTLNKMPIYSSVYSVYRYEDGDGLVYEEEHVLVGTEHGVYRTTDINANPVVWVADEFLMGDVPVLDMRQQNMSHPDQEVVTVIDGVASVTIYPGVRNQGMIYAATYGKGLFRCENYRSQYSGTNVHETPAEVAQSTVTMYPNPVRDAATVSFELNDNAAVSYQVYDFSGRMVKAERMGNYGQGKHEVNVSVDGLAKGAYVLRLNAGSKTSSVKFMVF